MTASTVRRKSISVIARNAAPIGARMCASGRPVQWAIGRATGSAVFLVEPVGPAWPLAAKFHFGI